MLFLKDVLVIIFVLIIPLSQGCTPTTTSIPSKTSSNDSTSLADPSPPPSPVPSAPPTSETPPLPSGDLTAESVGTKTRVFNLFDRWTLKTSVTAGRGSQYADVTFDCHGKIELDYALTASDWQNKNRRQTYYRNVNALIESIGNQLLKDHGNIITGIEKEVFLRALKALAWQESQWQHYVRYKNWFFIFLSGGSYNALDDWGVSQVARSGFSPSELLNVDFFSNKDYCKISTTLYYGFNEYYNDYLEARQASCNQTGNLLDKILGAYNRYSSGYSACYNGLSSDSAYRNYQINAMKGLKTHYETMPWLALISP